MKIKYVFAIHRMQWLSTIYYFTFKWTAKAWIGIHGTKAWFSKIGNFKILSAKLEVWYAIKLSFKIGKYVMLQTAFWASVFEWHKRSKEGRESVSGWYVWKV